MQENYILSSIAYDEFVDYKRIYTEGITKITPSDIMYAEKMNSTIKLIAMSEKLNGMIGNKGKPGYNRKHPSFGRGLKMFLMLFW